MNSVQTHCDWLAAKKNWKKLLFQALFRRYWPMWLFCLCCVCIYTHSVQKKQNIALELQSRIAQLSSQKQLMLDQQEDFQMQIQSQEDPAWIEMTLMKNLGVVPEGQVKITFDHK